MDFKFIGTMSVFLFVIFMRGIDGGTIVRSEMQQQKPAVLRAKRMIRKNGTDDKWLGEGTRAKSLKQSLNGNYYDGGYEVVGITVQRELGIKGAFATISVHHPEGVKPGQYSSARVRLQSYNEYWQTEEFVEAGWTVNPDLYGDDRTRLYTRWQGITTRGCYNTDCPGFVITGDQIPINYAFPEISDPWMGKHHDVDIDIQLGEDMSWYLKVNGIQIGYWSYDLFLSLASEAAAVFAGEVYSKPPTHDSPPMGSGQFKGKNPAHTAYMKNVQVRLDDQFFVPPPDYYKTDRSRCYLAGWDGYFGGELYGFSFLFGGTGGRAGEDCLDG